MFKGLVFTISGLPFAKQAEVRRVVTAQGGAVNSMLTFKTNYVISTPDDVAGHSVAVREASSKGLPVVSADFVGDCVEAKTVIDWRSYNLTDETLTPRVKRLKLDSPLSMAISGSDTGSAAATPEVVMATTPVSATAAAVADHTAFAARTTGPWRTARVFISSTFKDMHGERDHLTRYVLSELQERCQKLRVHVIPVDLRWGVTSEETQQALSICLEEVDNCRPFFIGMVGQRYGWVPSEYVAESQALDAWLQTQPAGLSVTALEMRYALKDKNTRAAFLFRDPAFARAVPLSVLADFETEKPEYEKRVDELKRYIKANAGSNLVIDNYGCTWQGVVDGKPMTGGLEAAGRQVLEFLWGAMVKEYAGDATTLTPLQVDRAYHDAFVENHAHGFVGRRDLRDNVLSFARGGSFSSEPLVICGEPGSGKSSLVAAVTRELMERQDFFVVPHFVGAAPGSTNIRNVLTRLSEELIDKFALDIELSDEYSELKTQFATVLTKASNAAQSRGMRVVIVIDAINQLDDTYNCISLDWLPVACPSHAMIVISTLDGRWLDSLSRHIPSNHIAVEALGREDCEEIVATTLWEYRKKLDAAQMRSLLAKPDASKPLYLKVACEELRMFGVYELVTERIRVMGPTIPDLFSEVLERLEKDHGRDLVTSTLSFLQCARGGVMESEMLALLAPCSPVPAKALPHAVWAHLYRSLRPYLRPPGESGEGILDFFHRQLAKAVQRRYLNETEDGNRQRYAAHRQLAEFFMSRADPAADHSWKGNHMRGVSELPHHLLLGRMWKELEETLCDLVFIEQKCRYGFSYDLVADYLSVAEEVDAQAKEPEEEGYRPPWLPPRKMSGGAVDHITEYQRFVQGRAHHLHRRPELTFSSAAAQPTSSPVAVAAARRWNLGLERRPYFRWTNKPEAQDPCIMTLQGHTMVVRSVSFCPSVGGAQRLVSCADDNTIKLWNAETGGEVSTFKGHTASVLCVRPTPDGSLVVSGSWDKTVALWDTSNGACLCKLEGHRGAVFGVAVCPMRYELLSGSRDKTCRVWDLESRTLLAVLEGHTAQINGVNYSADGMRAVSASGDRTAKVWDMTPGASFSCLATLTGHRKGVTKAVFAPNGKFIVTSSEDRTVRVWHGRGYDCMAVLEAHKDVVVSVNVNPTCDTVMSVSQDNLIILWDTTTWAQKGLFVGHTGTVFECDFSADGKRIATCSFDRSLKIWLTALAQPKIEGHTARILDVAYSADGRGVLSASRDKTLKLWDSSSAKTVHDLVGHASNVFGCDWAPSGASVVSASRDHTLKVWDTKTGQCLHTVDGHTGIVYAVAYDPQGFYFLSGSEDKTARLWNPDGTPLATLFGHRDQVRCVAISPDGRKIATGSDDCTCKLWDARTRRKLATLCHKKPVTAVAFSWDSARVTTGSEDYVVREFSAVNAKPLGAPMLGHKATVTGVGYSMYSRDGVEYIYSGSTDSLIIAWDAHTKKECMAFACLARVTTLDISPSKADMGAFAVGDGSGGLYMLLPVYPESK